MNTTEETKMETNHETGCTVTAYGDHNVCVQCLEIMQPTEAALREALRIVMSYPSIRQYIGTQVSEIADAALALSGREG